MMTTRTMPVSMLVCIIILLCITPLTVALGISPAKTTIDSEDTKSYSGKFLVINNDLEDMEVQLAVQGEMAQYIALETRTLSLRKDGGVGTVSFIVTLPTPVPPGESLAAIVVQQVSTAQNNRIGSQIVLYHKIIVQGPYPDKYVVAKLNFHESGNNIRFVSEVENKGKKGIDQIQTTFFVNNKEQVQQKFETDTTSLQPKENKLLDTTVQKDLFDRGEFEVLALTTYDGQKTEVIKKLLVGKPEVDITYFDTFFTANEINTYTLELLNKWNAPLENVYVDVNVKKDAQKVDQFRTKSIDLAAEMSKRISDYFDARDKNPGAYQFEMVVHFLSIFTMEARTFTAELLPKAKAEEIQKNAAPPLTGEAAAISQKTPMRINTILWWALGGLLAAGILGYAAYRFRHRDEYEGGGEGAF